MEPQRLKSRQGWEWIKQGYALFMKAPLLWIVLLFIWFIAAVVISSVPIVGGPLVSLLTPVVMAGLMSGCRSLEQGEDLELAHLFNGFKQHTSQLVTLGGITLVSQYLILGIMMVVGGATLVGLLMSGQPDPDPNVLIAALNGAVFAVSLGLVLYLFLTSVIQFSTLLVYFNGISPIQAIQLTIQAFLYNIWPMLVFGITFLLLAILATLPMGLGWLVLLPMSFTSLYASYCDIFPTVKEAGSTPMEGDVISPDDSGGF
jgi:hypothetical protein